MPITLFVRPIPTEKFAPAPIVPRAVRLRRDLNFDRLRVRADCVVEVVTALAPGQDRGDRTVVTESEAAALIELGLAEPAETATVIRFPGAW